MKNIAERCRRGFFRCGVYGGNAPGMFQRYNIIVNKHGTLLTAAVTYIEEVIQ